ncbi:hypothetical protein PV327_005172 [Microctonus hyperodae]|uniref:Uncharacterized protein n=1 Tax=Microctonus hyperodae TaxID=165561 RepID=A0AA39G0U2_MICHY|nr:hypothetical protein PV327_005172 [Microctonus hyperodae]
MLTNEDSLDQQQQFYENIIEKNLILIPEDNPSSAQRNNASPTMSMSSNCDTPQNDSSVIIPGPVSPVSSISTSGISSVSQRRSKKRSRHDSTEDNFSGAINNLAKSLKKPIVISNIQDTHCSSEDPSINGLLSFVGAMLQSFQDEELKLEVMSTLSQTVINARTLDLQLSKK